jgi:hypothetical protein
MSVDPMAWVMDTTWYSSGVLFWHITENVVGLLGCCLPTYRPLVKRFLPMLGLSTRGASSGSSAPQSGSLKYQARAYYRRQKENEWPMVMGADGRARAAGHVSGDHELEDWPRNQIFVRKEFQTKTSMV